MALPMTIIGVTFDSGSLLFHLTSRQIEAVEITDSQNASRVPTLFIVIPVYNEEATLEECVRRVEDAPIPDGFSRRLVLVDDASTDGTPSILKSMQERHSLGWHDRNLGKGAALMTGFDAILNDLCGPVDDDSDLIIIQDADLEYDPNDYLELVRPIVEGRTSVVFGFRFGGHRAPTTFVERLHRMGNAILSALSNLMTGYHVSDMECCYKVFRLSTTRRIRPDLTENRFGIEPQMAAALARIGEPIVNVPILYVPRSFEHGKKIKWTDGVRAIWVIIRERFRRKRNDERTRTSKPLE